MDEMIKRGWLVLPDGRVAAGGQTCIPPSSLLGLLQNGIIMDKYGGRCRIRRIAEHTVWLGYPINGSTNANKGDRP